MLQNAPDFNQEEMKYSWLKVIKQSKELLNWFSKKDIAKRFVAFLQEECKDLWLDHKEITKIINKLTKYYSKKNSVKDLQAIIGSIESLFTNQKFIDRMETFLSEVNVTDFAKTFFYKNGRFTYKNLKDSLLARVKRYNLSYKAIGELSKKEILDVLQVNNKFKGKDNLNHRIIDVKWRWKDKIFLLQNYKTAKMVDGKLVIIEDNIDKKILSKDIKAIPEIVEQKIEPIIQTDSPDIENEMQEQDKETNESTVKDQNQLSKIDEKIVWDPDTKQNQNEYTDKSIKQYNQQEMIWVSWKTYNIIDDPKTISRSKKSVNIVTDNWEKYRFILMPDWNILDSCKWNDWKDYEIIDYISANQNTGSMDIVKIKDTDGKQKNLRLLTPEYWKYIIQNKILIKQTWIINRFKKEILAKYFYKFIGKKIDSNDDVFDIENFDWDGDKWDFVYTLSNWKKVNMDNVNIK